MKKKCTVCLMLRIMLLILLPVVALFLYSGLNRFFSG